MRKLLSEIRSQPHHIRNIFMWVCTAIVFSLIFFYWVRQTRQEFSLLLNKETPTVEIQDTQERSIFANISAVADDIQASINTLLGRSDRTVNNDDLNATGNIQPRPLPLAQ